VLISVSLFRKFRNLSHIALSEIDVPDSMLAAMGKANVTMINMKITYISDFNMIFLIKLWSLKRSGRSTISIIPTARPTMKTVILAKMNTGKVILIAVDGSTSVDPAAAISM
jgi:hypothetical protein